MKKLFPDSWASETQKEVFNDNHRFRVLVAGRRFGKSTLSIMELLRAAQTTNDGTVLYVAPTSMQAKKIGWHEFYAWAPKNLITNHNSNELIIYCNNGTRVIFSGADNYSKQIRGLGVNPLCVIDEAGDMDRMVWEQAVRPALSDHQADCLFIGTPMGHNWFYDLYQFARMEENQDWKAWQFTTLQGGFVPEEEIDNARRELSPQVFKAEYEASFEELGDAVYSNFSRADNISDAARDLEGIIYIGMDFNVDPMSACIGSRKEKSIYIHDEITIMNGNTEEMCREIRHRYPNRPIIVYPDPSGGTRSTATSINTTNFTIIQDHGFTLRRPSKAPPVVDRINEVQSALLDASGSRRLLINPRCNQVIRSLMGQTYKPGTSLPDKSAGLDHMNDALGYLIHGELPINSMKATVTRFTI